MKKILFFGPMLLITLSWLVIPLAFANATTTSSFHLVRKCTYGPTGNGTPVIGTNLDGTKEIECGFLDLIAQIKQLIDLAFILAMPVAVAAFAYSGIKILLAHGNYSEMSKAKGLMMDVLVGFLIILGAWLFVYTITNLLLRTDSPENRNYNLFLGDPSSKETVKTPAQ